jgi:hypothetical protein
VEWFNPEMMSWILGDCQTIIEFVFFFMLLLLLLMLNDDWIDNRVPSGRQANKLKICKLEGGGRFQERDMCWSERG